MTLRTKNPFDLPTVDPKYAAVNSCALQIQLTQTYNKRYLDHPADLKKLIRGMKLLLRIAQAEPFSTFVDHEFKEPILDHQLHLKSDEEIGEEIQKRFETIYHPTSTCRMAPLNEGGVVDGNLNVYGIKGLRGTYLCLSCFLSYWLMRCSVRCFDIPKYRLGSYGKSRKLYKLAFFHLTSDIQRPVLALLLLRSLQTKLNFNISACTQT